MKIKKCRNCSSKNLKNLFSLGNLSFTGKFPKGKFINIKKANLSLVMCSNCFLVQLSKNYNLKYLSNISKKETKKMIFFIKKLQS